MFKMKLIVAFVLLITMCTGVAGATWTSSIEITALPVSSDGSSPPPATYVRTFGVDDNATDGFDRNYDVTAPPLPMIDALDTYFPCSHEVVTRLATDMKADADTITWTLKVTVPSNSTVNMNWNTSNAPSDKTLVMNTGSASIDMKTQSSTTFETGSYSLYITSSKVVQDDTTPPSSGGGGSGGSGSSGEKYENIEIKDVVREYTTINEETSYEFKEESNPIETIKFTSLKNAGEISSMIEVLKGRSTLVKNDPSGKVYQNINIWVGKSGFATSNNIADVKVGFKVEKSWIEANDIVVSTIRLCRYYGDVWIPLPTKKSGEDGKYIYFESETPGFSPFSITGSMEGVAAQSSAASLMSSPNTDSMSSTVPEQIDTQASNEGVSMVWFVVGALMIILVGGSAYWMHKAKNKEK
ncbi:MAG: PGF-pre-PGF domain-containing protein [Methanosarcinaceae archaeon]|nr:PGF-pre-PGF domain-containing protein [Methanosarcinaceae archaeon]